MSSLRSWISLCSEKKAKEIKDIVSSEQVEADVVARNNTICDILCSGKYWNIYWCEYSRIGWNEICVLIVFDEGQNVDRRWWDMRLYNFEYIVDIGMDNRISGLRAYLLKATEQLRPVKAMKEVGSMQTTRERIGNFVYIGFKGMKTKIEVIASTSLEYRIAVLKSQFTKN